MLNSPCEIALDYNTNPHSRSWEEFYFQAYKFQKTLPKRLRFALFVSFFLLNCSGVCTIFCFVPFSYDIAFRKTCLFARISFSHFNFVKSYILRNAVLFPFRKIQHFARLKREKKKSCERLYLSKRQSCERLYLANC